MVKRKKETKPRNRNYFGEANPFYGKHHTEKTKREHGKIIEQKWKQLGYKENQSEKRKGQHSSPKTQFKKGIIPWNKNLKGIHLSPKTEFKGGDTPWNKNVPCSKKTKEKISKSNKGKLSGEKHPSFNNWSSREPYGVEFSPELKEKLDIHHINYDKNNNSEINFISLCRKCHSKTNFNRNHWTRFFQMQIFIKEFFNPENILIFNEKKQLIGLDKFI